MQEYITAEEARIIMDKSPGNLGEFLDPIFLCDRDRGETELQFHTGKNISSESRYSKIEKVRLPV